MTANLYPPLFTWATAEVNYPAGGNPWNGQPVLLLPVGDIFTPNTKPPAQYFNYVLNKLASGNDAAVLAATALVSVENWAVAAQAVALTGTEHLEVCAYDGVNDKLIFSVRDTFTGSAGLMFANSGISVDSFAVIGALPLIPNVTKVCDVCKDPTDSKTYYVAIIDSSLGSARVYKCDTQALTTTSILNDPTAGWTDVKLSYLTGAGRLIVAYAASGSGQWTMQSTANQGATWQGITSSVGVTGWVVSSNGTTFVAIGRSATTPVEVTSTTGLTFTTQTAGFSGQVPGGGVAVPFGIAWGSDSAGAAWFVGMNRSDIGGGSATWLRSADAIIWTTTAGSVANSRWLMLASTYPNLVAIGGLLVSMAADTADFTRVLYSVDGAKTWWVTPFRSGIGGNLTIAAAPNRLIACTGAAGLSGWVSYAQGVSGVQAT